MICVEFRDRVEELLDGLLLPEESARLEKHSAACSECALEFENAAKFLNFLDDDGREAIETFDALNITAQVARRVARDAVQVGPEPIPVLPQVPILRRWPVRLAAVAAVLALAFLLPSLGDGNHGPTVLAVGKPIQLDRDTISQIRDGVAVRTDRAALLEVESGQGRKVVSLEGGSALFMTDLDEELSVITARGVAETGGSASFQVEMHDDQAVAVSVLSGQVQFIGVDDGRHRIRAGQRFELPKNGQIALMSMDRLHELELRLAMRDNMIASLRGDRQRLEEEVASLRTARAQRNLAPRTSDVAAGDLDVLPWKELAEAARILLLRRRDWRYSDPERNRAVAVFFFHSDKIQELTGVDNPMDGLYHPAFVARMAEPFFQVLAPYAPVDDRRAAAARVQSAAKVAHGKLRDELVPTENVAVRLELFSSMLRSTKEHLGDAAAAELADGMHVLDTLASVRSMRYTEDSATDVMAFWGKHFDLVEQQREALMPIAERYVLDCLAAQRLAETRLGDRANEVLYKSRWRNHRRDAAKKDEEPTVERSGEERLTFALAAIQAKLDLATPRIAFEKSLRTLLRDDQKARGFGRFWGLLSFRTK